MNQIHINDKVGQQKKILGHLYIMNRNFKLKVNSPTISTITSHLNSVITKKTIMYNIGNTGPGVGQAQKCGSIEWPQCQYIYKQTMKKTTDSLLKIPHTIKRMNDHINMDLFCSHL